MTKETEAIWQDMRDWANAYFISQMLYVAAKLGIADLLAEGPKDIATLATKTQTHAQSLYRLLRALASIGVFREVEQKQFKLTPHAECLRIDSPISLRANIIYRGEPWYWLAWGNLLYSVKTGESAFSKINGIDFFDFCTRDSEVNSIFCDAMVEGTKTKIKKLVSAYDFSGIDKIADIGGGRGSLIVEILRCYPKIQGILFDTPEVVASARETIELEIPLDRCEIIGGDFFQSVPKGCACYILKSVIHDWSDREAVKILENCRRAMREHDKLLLVEHVIPEGNATHWSKISDLNTWVISGGKERTANEYHELLANANFELTGIISTPIGRYIIESVAI